MSMDEFIMTLTEEQKAMLLKALTNDNIKQSNEIVVEDKNTFITSSKPRLANQKRREPVRAKQNTWNDSGEDRNIETPQYQPTPRTREKIEKISVQCHACKKEFTIDPRFVYGEYYRCDRCSSRR